MYDTLSEGKKMNDAKTSGEPGRFASRNAHERF